MAGNSKNVVFIGIIAVIVLLLGYVLWTRSVPPEPTIPPDQSLHNPFGNSTPGGQGKKATEAAGQ